MKLRTYSSLAAFVALYAALRADHSDGSSKVGDPAPNPDDAATLAEMERIVSELSSADRDALQNDAANGEASTANAASSGAAARHRARAELHLRRLLTARGLLTG